MYVSAASGERRKEKVVPAGKSRAVINVVMQNSSSLIRAVINFGDGSRLNTTWYEKGNPKLIEAMMRLARRARREVSRVKWETKPVKEQ